jgi:phosphoribosylanthranilate isomerase
VLYGYAGGINPDNIQKILERIQENNKGNQAVWIDMESSLRVKIIADDGSVKDNFCVSKCFECIIIGVKYFGLQRI